MPTLTTQRLQPWLLLRISLGSLWACLLVVGGATCPTWAPQMSAAPLFLQILVGATSVAMGHFVPFVVVADRLFPRSRRQVRHPLEMASATVMLGGLLVIVLYLMTGSSA